MYVLDVDVEFQGWTEFWSDVRGVIGAPTASFQVMAGLLPSQGAITTMQKSMSDLWMGHFVYQPWAPRGEGRSGGLVHYPAYLALRGTTRN